MKILIIGYGYVGQAVAGLFRHIDSGVTLLSHSEVDRFFVTSYDPDPSKGATWSDRMNGKFDVAYVCVPTPTVDGKCDVSMVLDAVDRAYAHAAIVVVKSTITPEHVTDIHAQYPDIVYEPEFLTQANAVNDIIASQFKIIGTTNMDNYKTLADIYGGVQTTPTLASAAKYSINSFLALKVAFMNELAEIFFEEDWDVLKTLITLDPRIGKSHTNVPGPDGKYGFGGACFPKDTTALKSYAEQHGFDPKILTATIEYNESIRHGDGR